jgi:hypothetical protein
MKFLLVIKSLTVFSNIAVIVTVIVSPFTFFTQYVTISVTRGLLISCLTVHMSSWSCPSKTSKAVCSNQPCTWKMVIFLHTETPPPLSPHLFFWEEGSVQFFTFHVDQPILQYACEQHFIVHRWNKMLFSHAITVHLCILYSISNNGAPTLVCLLSVCHRRTTQGAMELFFSPSKVWSCENHTLSRHWIWESQLPWRLYCCIFGL